ncbi:FAD-binding protein [Klebsiella variicola]|nr:FAD-binding protein [Klebsiella variicola]
MYARCAAGLLVDSYPEEEYWQDLLRVTEGNTNEALARMVIRTSSQCRDWMRQHGVNFQPPLSGALHVARTNAFFMGGGKALVNAYYRSAEQMGGADPLQHTGAGSELRNGEFVAALAGEERIVAKSCVLAAGGFESNREWLREAWGKMTAVNGPPITFSSAAPASTRECCSSL